MNEHEATIIRYENQRQLVESLLGDTLQTVARGRVPDEGLMESLCESVEAMRSSNAELELAAMGFDDSAGPGESAFRYIEAIREGVKRELRDRHDRAVATLRSFVGIRSSDAAYDLAIDPYREEARGLLDKLDASDVSVPAEEGEHEIERKMLVLRVISSASFETEEMADLLYEISHAYPRKVYQGIMVRRYSLMDAADMPSKTAKGAHDEPVSLDSHTSPGQGPETRVDGRMGEHASVGTGAAHTQGSQADTIRRGDMVDSEDALNVGAAEEENSTENLSAQRSDHTAEGDVKTVEDHVEASESVDESAIDETGIQTEHIPSDEMPAPLS